MLYFKRYVTDTIKEWSRINAKNRVMLVADDIDVNRASFRAMFEEEYEVLEAGGRK